MPSELAKLRKKNQRNEESGKNVCENRCFRNLRNTEKGKRQLNKIKWHIGNIKTFRKKITGKKKGKEIHQMHNCSF